MFIVKTINGTVVSYTSARENYMRMDYGHMFEDVCFSDNYDLRYEERYDYFVVYKNFLISYPFDGQVKEVLFNDAILNDYYNVNDEIRLRIDKRKGTVSLYN